MKFERTLMKLKRADEKIINQQFVIGVLVAIILSYALGEFIASI